MCARLHRIILVVVFGTFQQFDSILPSVQLQIEQSQLQQSIGYQVLIIFNPLFIYRNVFKALFCLIYPVQILQAKTFQQLHQALIIDQEFRCLNYMTCYLQLLPELPLTDSKSSACSR